MHPREISEALGIHYKVVGHHLTNMYRKYAIRDGAKQVKLAVALYYERHPEARV
jgi:DNA-binding CsgD family transcriptional regulator